MAKFSCLGPKDSYSECAAKSFGAEEIILCRSFREAVETLERGGADYAVLPVENALNGGVSEALDLLAEHDVFGTAELPLPIDHRLAVKEGTDLGKIERIFSHEQAFGQCTEYLSKHFADAQLLRASSTAESLSMLDGRTAGIVGAHAAREGVILSEENIADNKSNFTKFLRLERRAGLPGRSVMVFLCAVCPHKPGSLVGLLKIFLRYSLNLTRIESRPVKNEFGQYRFFIEFAGDVGSERVQKALGEAERYCKQFKLLGAYN